MSDFCRRLRACMKAGDMTVADMHHWFGRPRATVRTWVIDARTPSGPAGNRAHLLLDLLERRIKKRAGFPIPFDISAHQRPGYVKKLRNANSDRVSSAYSA